jgi:hypothetical protein
VGGFVDGPDTLGKQDLAKVKREFALAAIGNDLFSGPSLLWG